MRDRAVPGRCEGRHHLRAGGLPRYGADRAATGRGHRRLRSARGQGVVPLADRFGRHGHPGTPPPTSPRQLRAGFVEPAPQCVGGRHSVRDRAFLATLAEDADNSARGVDVVDVEGTEFADADAGRVEQFHDRQVTQADRAAVVRRHGRRVEHGTRVGLPQHSRQALVRPRTRQQRARIRADPSGSLRPGGEDTRGGGAARHRAACLPEALLLGQPRPQPSDIQAFKIIVTKTNQMFE